MHAGPSYGRLDRLRIMYSSAMSEVYLMFYQAALQLFVNFNKFMQREDPIICVLWNQMNTFMTKLFGRFVRVTAIKAAADVCHVQYSREENQLPGA